jgi:TRAP transporter TAXI family solute receptor
MMHRHVIAAIALAALAPASASAQVLSLATGPQGSWAFSAAAAIAKVASEGNLQMRVQPFGGSSTFIPLLNTGEQDLGIANEAESDQALKGEDIFDKKPNPNLRVIGVIAPLRSFLFARADSPYRMTKDVKGLRIPSEYGGQRIIQTVINAQLANGGLTMADMQALPVPNVSRGAEEYAAGRVDIFSFAIGAGKVQEVNAKYPVRVLSVDPSAPAVAAMRKVVPVAYPLRVEPGPGRIGVIEPAYALAYDYLALANAKVADSTVYSMAKSLHGNEKALLAAFSGLEGFAPKRMAKKLDALQYHPGAIKYYTEAGEWPPKD